jgi:hypothetical protein
LGTLDTVASVDDQIEETSELGAEAVYRWTIRALYLFAFAVNFWMVYDAYKDTIEVRIARQRLGEWWGKVTRRAREPGAFRKATNRMLWEAMETVEPTTRPDADAPEG